MARIRLSPGVIDDFDRIAEHLEQHGGDDVAARVSAIVGAFDVLADNPLIGRPARNEMRELIIGRGPHGYVALHRFLPVLDIALILAIRGQREAGFARP